MSKLYVSKNHDSKLNWWGSWEVNMNSGLLTQTTHIISWVWREYASWSFSENVGFLILYYVILKETQEPVVLLSQ